MERKDRLVVAALALLSVVSLGPLLVPALQGGMVLLPTRTHQVLGMSTVVAVMLGCLLGRSWLDQREQLWPAWLSACLALTAALMTLLHFCAIDQTYHVWQFDLYYDILNNTPDVNGPRTPHQFRPLPYGFARSVEWLSGDWLFSCLSYRWFFNYWFLWASARLARKYLTARQTYLSLLPLMFLYPYSIESYWGQLTDPLSHTLFVLALYWLLEKRFIPLLFALALGILVKETVVLVVVAYALCELGDVIQMTQNRGRALVLAAGRTFILGMGCITAFLAIRLPRGWRPGNRDMNGLDAYMFGTNLGIGTPIAYSDTPLYFHYQQTVLFFLTFLPLVVVDWQRTDRRLKLVLLALAPLLLLSNLAYSWACESRNYMPLLPVFSTLAVLAAIRSQESGVKP